MSQYEAKQAERRANYAARADKARSEAEAKHGEARRRGAFIPMGQPILAGHHSEKRHRRDLAGICRLEDQAHDAFNKAKHYDRKAASYGTHSINADDPDAVAKLGEKLARMETQREDIKAENKRLRKAGEETAPAYILQNLGGNIRRVRERIKTLEAKAAQSAAAPVAPIECDGFTVEECPEDNRLRFLFDGKPAPEIRAIMKRGGFRWAPSVGAWQRQITPAARESAAFCQREIARHQMAAA